MKALHLLILTTMVVACAATAALAVTEAWSYGDDLAAVYQILADGTGGCAMFGFATHGETIIVWLDKKGTATYAKRVASSLGLASINKNGIVYSSSSAPPAAFTHVDKKGIETTVADAGFSLMPTMLFPTGLAQNPADSKGFFAMKAPTGPGSFKVARFTYK